MKAFRRWHVKKSRIWQEGYHIWGRIVADQWLSKSKWAAKGTNDLFNLIMNGKITVIKKYHILFNLVMEN